MNYSLMSNERLFHVHLVHHEHEAVVELEDRADAGDQNAAHYLEMIGEGR